MNFRKLDRLLAASSYDEIKVIAKDVEADGYYAHIIGMTLKDKQALVYVLELTDASDDGEECVHGLADRTHRQEMKDNCKNEKDIKFLRVREFHTNGNVYAVAGANSSIAGKENMAENMLFYTIMKQHGWNMSKESPLYTVGWKRLQMTVIELRDEMEELPDWGADLRIVSDSYAKTELLEIPVILTCGEKPQIPFLLADGTQAECYINKICIKDVWADLERRFEDEEYKNKALEHMNEEEFYKMQKQCEEALLADCPRGKCYMLVEYECNRDVSLNFYATSYLDSQPKVHAGSASSLLIMHRPEKKEGVHGIKLRGCVIQTPIDPDTTSLEAELFSYVENITKVNLSFGR